MCKAFMRTKLIMEELIAKDIYMAALLEEE